MSKLFSRKKMGNQKKALVMKVTALFATTSLVLAPVQASAGLLDGVLSNPVGTVTSTVQGTVGTVTSVAQPVVSTVGAVASNPVGTVSSVVSNPVGTVTGVAQPVVSAVGGVVSGTVGTVAGTAQKAGSTVGGAAANPVGTVAEVAKPVVSGAVSTVGNVVNTVGSTVASVVPAVQVAVGGTGTSGQGGTSGLVNATVLVNQKLTGTPSKLDANSKKIVLNYSGEGVLDLSLLTDLKVVFKMPEEFAGLLKDPNFKKALSASYNAPGLKVLNIPLLESKGTFSADQIHIDTETNSVYMNYKDFLNVSVLSNEVYNFQLEIALDKLPCAVDNEYTFYGYTSNSLIDVSVLEAQAAALDIPVEFAKGACEGNNGGGNNGGGNNDGDNNGNTGGNNGGSGDNGSKAGNDGGAGGALPITNTNLGNFALIGLLTLLVGLAVRMLGFSKVAN